MPKLTEEMKRLVEDQGLGFMATVCEDGTPNLSPKGLTFVLDDEHLVIGEVRSPQTVSNLLICPTAEINVVDPIKRKGYPFKGPCDLHAKGQEFDRLVRFLRSRGAKSQIRSVIVMTIERAVALISPAYDTGASELEVRRVQLRRMLERNKDISNE